MEIKYDGQFDRRSELLEDVEHPEDGHLVLVLVRPAGDVYLLFLSWSLRRNLRFVLGPLVDIIIEL
jgi:hypothetical protein